MRLHGALLQIPGVDAPDLTLQEQLVQLWGDTGFMRWPLALCLVLGILVIIWKFIDLTSKASRTKRILKGGVLDVDRGMADIEFFDRRAGQGCRIDPPGSRCCNGVIDDRRILRDWS